MRLQQTANSRSVVASRLKYTAVPSCWCLRPRCPHPPDDQRSSGVRDVRCCAIARGQTREPVDRRAGDETLDCSIAFVDSCQPSVPWGVGKAFVLNGSTHHKGTVPGRRCAHMRCLDATLPHPTLGTPVASSANLDPCLTHAMTAGEATSLLPPACTWPQRCSPVCLKVCGWQTGT